MSPVVDLDKEAYQRLLNQVEERGIMPQEMKGMGTLQTEEGDMAHIRELQQGIENRTLGTKAKDVGEIRYLLNKQTMMLDDIQKVLSEVHERIYPILREDEPQAVPQDDNSINTELGALIFQNNEKIDYVIRYLASITQRVDL